MLVYWLFFRRCVIQLPHDRCESWHLCWMSVTNTDAALSKLVAGSRCRARRLQLTSIEREYAQDTDSRRRLRGLLCGMEAGEELRRGEAQVTVIDPRPYMTYQPFLPEVMAGSIEPRHAVVSLRSHLRRTEVVAGTVTAVDHANKKVTVRPPVGPEFNFSYDIIVVTAGAVTRTFPIAGIAEQAIGLKHIEEAIAVRNRLLAAFDEASNLSAGPERKRLLTVTFVGGGFAGVEGFGELLSLATALLRFYPKLQFNELNFRLVEAQGRILPEVSENTAARVVRSLEKRGAHIHLNTQILSATDGHVVLSSGDEFDSNLIV
jgi:NADH:quinone reductase (non-electrogenic)